MTDDPTVVRPATRDLATLVGRGRLPVELHRASGMRRLDWVLGLPAPQEFVQSLAPEALYLLLEDIGVGDSWQLLPFASGDQLRGIMDLDLWQGNEVRMDRWVRWIDLALLDSHETAFEIVRATEDELVGLFATAVLQIHTRDLDLDTVPDELQALQTPDGAFWVTIDREHPLADRLSGLLKLMWAADMERMRDIFQTARFEVVSNLEETLIHFRRGRLEEMGFPAPDEALEVYRGVDPTLHKKRLLAELADRAPLAGWAAPEVAQDSVLRGVRAPDLLARTLGHLDGEERSIFGHGMTSVVHKVFMANVRDISQVELLPLAGRYAASLTNLGLAFLSDEDEERAVRVLQVEWPQVLFQVGFGLVRELGLRARRLRRRAGVEQGLTPFGSPLDEALEGLDQLRPTFFEGLEGTGAESWRPFRDLSDLARSRVALDDAEAILSFFERELGFRPDVLSGEALVGVTDETRRYIRFATLARTLIANMLLADEASFRPLDRSDIVAFLGLAIDGDKGPSERLRAALADLAGRAPAGLARWVERAVEELSLALGRVHEHDLDPRYAAELLLVRGT